MFRLLSEFYTVWQYEDDAPRWPSVVRHLCISPTNY